MKICPHCQQGYSDDVRYCAGCGTALVHAVPARRRSEFLCGHILGFLYGIFAILSATFSGVTLATPYIAVEEYYARVYREDGTCILALMTAVAALGLAISLYVYTLIKRRQCRFVFPTILKVLAGVGLLAMALVLLD
ncbi:MAG: hypothetical protein E7541_06855 [Ruminococcaceae bacterium]|nr:hypothetical protein [Oscillospiraceae bacterium]